MADKRLLRKKSEVIEAEGGEFSEPSSLVAKKATSLQKGETETVVISPNRRASIPTFGKGTKRRAVALPIWVRDVHTIHARHCCCIATNPCVVHLLESILEVRGGCEAQQSELLEFIVAMSAQCLELQVALHQSTFDGGHR